jgi:hypothetical protein
MSRRISNGLNSLSLFGSTPVCRPCTLVTQRSTTNTHHTPLIHIHSIPLSYSWSRRLVSYSRGLWKCLLHIMTFALYDFIIQYNRDVSRYVISLCTVALSFLMCSFLISDIQTLPAHHTAPSSPSSNTLSTPRALTYCSSHTHQKNLKEMEGNSRPLFIASLLAVLEIGFHSLSG